MMTRLLALAAAAFAIVATSAVAATRVVPGPGGCPFCR